jgi:hypothetical protein
MKKLKHEEEVHERVASSSSSPRVVATLQILGRGTECHEDSPLQREVLCSEHKDENVEEKKVEEEMRGMQRVVRVVTADNDKWVIISQPHQRDAWAPSIRISHSPTHNR